MINLYVKFKFFGSVIVAFVTIIGMSSCASVNISENEKTQLIHPESIQPYYGVSILDSCQYQKQQYFDGSSELQLEIEVDTPEEYLYILNTVSLERNISDAIATYGFEQMGTKLFDNGLKKVSIDSTFTLGDQSNLDLLLDENNYPVGNFFHCRIKKKVTYLIILGIYFEDSESWNEFISHHLTRLSGFNQGSRLHHKTLYSLQQRIKNETLN